MKKLTWTWSLFTLRLSWNETKPDWRPWRKCGLLLWTSTRSWRGRWRNATRNIWWLILLMRIILELYSNWCRCWFWWIFYTFAISRQILRWHSIFLASTYYEDYIMIISSYVMIMIDDHSIMICYDNNDYGNNLCTYHIITVDKVKTHYLC